MPSGTENHTNKRYGMYEKQLEAMERLFGVMDRLRVECPWDREQTFESLRNNTIEETFELTDAITDGDMDGIRAVRCRIMKTKYEKLTMRLTATAISTLINTPPVLSLLLNIRMNYRGRNPLQIYSNPTGRPTLREPKRKNRRLN